MRKLTAAIALALVLVLSSSVAYAASPTPSAKPTAISTVQRSSRSAADAFVPANRVVYEKTFTVTSRNATVRVGFVTMQFPKNSLPEGVSSMVFTARVFADDGKAVLEVLPDTDGFKVPVRITAGAYRGWLYDEALNTNTWVSFRPYTLYVDHFSRYCWQ